MRVSVPHEKVQRSSWRQWGPSKSLSVRWQGQSNILGFHFGIWNFIFIHQGEQLVAGTFVKARNSVPWTRRGTGLFFFFTFLSLSARPKSFHFLEDFSDISSFHQALLSLSFNNNVFPVVSYLKTSIGFASSLPWTQVQVYPSLLPW